MTVMNDVTQPPQSDGAMRLGRALAEARIAAGLSVDEVAAKLRMSPRQIHALESEDVASLPGPAFVRGFIRNYAKLLQLDAAPLLEAYRMITPATPQQAITLHSENIPIMAQDRKTWLPYALAAALVGVALGGWMAYMDYHVPSQPQPTQVAATSVKPAPQPLAPSPAVAQTVTDESAPVALPAPQPENVSAPPEASGTSVTTPVETPQAPGLARLRLTFLEKVWVSVVDREGKEIFNKTKPAGSEEIIEGLPPLQLVIGNAAGVRLSYNDQDVDLVPYTKANVARLTLE